MRTTKYGLLSYSGKVKDFLKIIREHMEYLKKEELVNN